MLSELLAGINRRWISFNIHIFASTMQCSNARILSNGCDLHRISQINELCVKYHPYPAPPCDVNTLVISRAHFQADRIKLATSTANAASHPHPQPQDSGFYFIFFSFFFFFAVAHFSRWAENGMPRAILPGLFKQPLQRGAIIILHYWYGKKPESKCHRN